MTYHALDRLGDALDATLDYLTPFDRSRWLRLALVVFFLGGTGSGGGQVGNLDTGNLDAGTPPTPGGFELPPLDPGLVAVVLGVLAVVVVVALVIAFVGSVMEFVLVEALRSETIHVRAFFRRYARPGLRLFGFRVALGLLTLVVLAVVVGAALLTGGVSGGFLGSLLVVAPVAVVVGLVSGLVSGLTTQFVVPVMLLEDRHVLDAWRRFWPALRGAWLQYLVYLVVRFVAALAIGIATAIVSVIAVVVLAIPFGLVFAAAILSGVLNGSIVGAAALVVVGLAFVLAAVVTVALVQVPAATYLRYYALLVLFDTEPDFDLIPDRRAALDADRSA